MRKVISQTFIFLLGALLMTEFAHAQILASNYSPKSPKHKKTTSLEKREDIAVIFAVSKHTKYARKLGWEDLKYSIEDARALKWTLENKFGFKVTLYEDPTWEQMNLAMKKLEKKNWNPLDQLLIFYSGHGHKGKDGTGYLVPSNVGESIKTYYEMEQLRSQIEQLDCNNVVLGIDACFSSTFLERGGRDIPRRSTGTSNSSDDLREYLSDDLPFRYFIGSSPSNREITERGIVLKEPRIAGNYKYSKKKFKVSEFMMSFLEAIEMGEKEYRKGPIPIWYVGRQIEELFEPKKPIKGQQIQARATRFGAQIDKGFHFIPAGKSK